MRKGFTLIELALVVVIISMLIGTVLGILAPTLKMMSKTKVRQGMTAAKDSIIAFASVNGRLPYPDLDNDGKENIGQSWSSATSSIPCSAFLPTLTLGTSTGADICYDPNSALLTTNTSNFCVVLYEVMKNGNSSSTPPILTTARRPQCSSPPNDSGDDGVIDPPGTGYTTGAVLLNYGNNGVWDGRQLGNNREYDLPSNPLGDDPCTSAVEEIDDIVDEVPLGELYAKICTQSNTRLLIQANDGSVCCGNSATSVSSCYLYTGESAKGCTGGVGTNCSSCSSDKSFDDLINCDWDGSGCYANSSSEKDGVVYWIYDSNNSNWDWQQ
ncbi:MAG: type II secretion system protein [Aquificae bacterium]|nr:type II secretion system protein [Aquificota bacterium]